jgi:hypothetical protein
MIEADDKQVFGWRVQATKRTLLNPGHYIERERVAVVVEDWLEQNEGGMTVLAQRTGLAEKQLSRIRGVGRCLVRQKSSRHGFQVDGPPKYITLDMVDRLLVGIDMVYLFHRSPEDGGFADVYFHPDVMEMDAA